MKNEIIATELPSLRSAFGKTFTVDAGKYKAYLGVTPIHRLNPETHVWEEIDARFYAADEKAARLATVTEPMFISKGAYLTTVYPFRTTRTML